ncbi:MAG: hypothetical protein JJU03_10500 [Idiomarina sp.]|nr:hypothetical protein [Idiomarina sp.]
MHAVSPLPLTLSACALTLLTLSACSDSEQMLEFNPQDGESRSYQVIADTFVETDSSYGRSTDYIRSMMLTDYQVEETEHTILHIRPNFMLMEYRNGSFASSREPGDFDKEVRELMSAGFQIHLDENMQVADFIYNAYDSDAQQAQRDIMLDMFKDEFTRPGVAHGLRLREGASHIIEATDEIPEVTITLSEIRGDEALVTMQGDNDKVKVFGLAVIDVDSGWVARATMVTDIEEEHQGSTATVRSVISMYPGDWAMGMDLEYLSETGMMPLQQESGEPLDFSNVSDPANEQQALPNPTGTIESRNDHLVLNYHHDSDDGKLDVNALGQFRFRDAQAFTINGEPLELALQLSEAMTYTSYGSGYTLTMADVFPLGWESTYAKLAELGYIQATVDWYPQTQQVVELEVGDDATTVSVGDAKATLQPTDNDGVYQLITEQGTNTHFDYRVIGATAVGIGYKAFGQAPDWLDVGESRLLTVTKYGYHPGYYEVYFEGEAPSHIQLLAFTAADTPTAHRQISFYDAEAMNANPYVAPADNTSLYASNREQETAKYGTLPLDALTFTARPEGAFELEDFGRAQLYLTLTPEQAGLCDIAVNADDLKLNELPAPEGQRLPMGKLNNPVILQLQSHDERQTFFYQRDIEVTTSCPADYQWQPIDWQASEHPWLIDISQLDGVDAGMPVSKLLRTYAFLPVAADAAPDSAEGIRALSLALMAPDTDDNINYFNAQVADYLYEDRYLRVSGTVKSVQQLSTIEGSEDERTLTHQFPPLPDMDTTFAESESAEGASYE